MGKFRQKILQIQKEKNSVKEILSIAATFLMQYGVPTLAAFIVFINSKTLSVENVIFALQLSISFSSYLYFLIYQFSAFVEIKELCDDYYDYIKLPLSSDDDSKEKKHDNIAIECKNVSFSYDNKIDVLDIKPNPKVVIVGRNGSGKTTLAKLLLNLYKPREGSINFYNNNVKINNNEVRKSVVFQDYLKFMISLRYNVGAGQIDKINNSEKIIKTLNDVNFHDKNFTDQLDQQIGLQFGGRDFSIGQWQKIAISRACFRENTELIILDEPIAALDPFTETQIINNYLNLSKNKTCIFISHRLSSIKLADIIIVMDEGEIKEIGTHDELMKNKKLYYNMFSKQSELYQ